LAYVEKVRPQFLSLRHISFLMYAPLAPEQFPLRDPGSANVDTPPISEPTNPAVAERIAVSILIS
jgi:hypothetical protein